MARVQDIHFGHGPFGPPGVAHKTPPAPAGQNPPRPGRTPADGASRPAGGAAGSCFSRLGRRLAETSEAPQRRRGRREPARSRPHTVRSGFYFRIRHGGGRCGRCAFGIRWRKVGLQPCFSRVARAAIRPWLRLKVHPRWTWAVARGQFRLVCLWFLAGPVCQFGRMPTSSLSSRARPMRDRP